MEKEEKMLLSNLDECVATPRAQAVIKEAVAKAETELQVERTKSGVSVQISLSVFGEDIPDFIKSCRVFVLRGATQFKTERHPNSTQRILSLKGAGEIRVFTEQGLRTASLRSDRYAAVDERWAVLEQNVWHQPVAGPKNWAVLAFHTAPEKELIDEYKE
jgi:hypothetical protein